MRAESIWSQYVTDNRPAPLRIPERLNQHPLQPSMPTFQCAKIRITIMLVHNETMSSRKTGLYDTINVQHNQGH